jgi:hypothetical protein
VRNEMSANLICRWLFFLNTPTSHPQSGLPVNK